MDIYFDDHKFQQECNDRKLLVRRYGQEMAKKIRQRLDDIDAAESLESFRSLPGRCHALLGDRSEQFSLDLVHPQRLIFICADDPIPRNKVGGLDWALIKSVRILGIEDTHD